MKQPRPVRITAFLLGMLLILGSAACTNAGRATPIDTSSLDAAASPSATTASFNAPASTAASTPASTRTPTPAPTPLPEWKTPIDFECRPYVMSSLYRETYGDAFVTEFEAMVSAYLAYEPDFPCSSLDMAIAINMSADVCFPLLSMDVGYFEYDEDAKKGILAYAMTKEEHEAGIEAFKDSITRFMTATLRNSDSEVTKAMALYMAYSRKIRYDYAALEDNFTIDLSAYRGLTGYAGICQTFGPAYAFLCLQAGIDAISAGGLSTDDQAHDWTLVRLEGSWYYMDTTFESGEGGLGLHYFGMTTEDRAQAGNYIEKTINIGGTNLLWGPDIVVDDDRFSDLHAAVETQLDRGNRQILCRDAIGVEWTVPLY